MAKNIILCSDGTGNTGIKGRGTNVFKLFEAIDLNGHREDPNLDAQLAFYDDGVATEGSTFLRIAAGAAGIGLARNVQDLYRELSRVYDPGDRIFLFGFSRGAFTVRTLAGLIGSCGVLRGEQIETARQLRTAVKEAYSAYRARYSSQLSSLLGRIVKRPDHVAATKALADKWPMHQHVRIHFIGVWDTVDAVGMPFSLSERINRVVVQFKFPTQELGAYVDRACHALAIDDARLAFEPVLWKVAAGDDRIDQVWFAGAHSNVGGGYPKHGLSLVALEWMLSKVAEAKLRLLPLDVELFRGHASVDDMLYNSRAGAGLFYRWAPRDIESYCRKSGATPTIHLSVAERIAHGTDDYAPGNIPPHAAVTFTSTGDPTKDTLVGERAAAMQKAIRSAFAGRGQLLGDVAGKVALATLSYSLFVASWVLLIVSIVLVMAGTWGSEPAPGAATLRGLSSAGFWCLVLWAGSAAAAWGLAHHAGNTMSDAFSRFWHVHQPALRAELKRVNAELRDATG